MKTRRFWILMSIAALLVAVAFGYLYFWQSRPIGVGPTGPHVPSAKFTHVWIEKPVLLIGIGDSVTAGFGARHGYSYFDLLISNPPDEFPDMKGTCLRAVLPDLHYTNLAVSGSTSAQHIARQLSHLPAVGSNVLGVVVITTGGNDLIHNYGRTPPREDAMYGASWNQAEPWIVDFESRLEQAVTQINNHFPGGCQIFLANIFDPTDGVGDIQRTGLPPWKDGLKILAAYNGVIRKCSDRHSFVHLVDLHDAFLGHGIHCTQFWSQHYDSKDPHYWYYTNLEDPNERGYDAIRRLFLIEMAETADQLR